MDLANELMFIHLQREVELRSIVGHSDIVKRREMHIQALKELSLNT